MTSVLVVSDQSLQRLGLQALLSAEPDLTVVGAVASGFEAVRMSAALLPHIVLMDGRTSTPDGIRTIRRVTRPDSLAQATTLDPAGARPSRVLVLTPEGDEGYGHAALRAGAAGALHQDATPAELIAAVRILATGDAVLTPDLTRALIEAVRHQGPTVLPPGREAGLDTLTERERDVLVAVAAGWSNAEIATRLSIAQTTVKSHVSNILGKIGAHARVQAVVFAYESGLVRPAA
jgi:DNA-binding NarL/FixJ family response regulator